MLLIWLLIMGSGATACQLLAHYQHERSEHADEGSIATPGDSADG